MGRYVIRRLLQMIPVFFGATFLIFAIMYWLPADPVQSLTGERKPSAEFRAQIEEEYHLNDPLIVQYGYYIKGVLHGDLGTTLRGQSVTEIFREKFPITATLALTSLVIEAVIGIAAGVLTALRRGGFLDNLVLLSTLFLISIPIFVFGYVCQWYLGFKLGWFPISGIQDGWPTSYILPAIVLAAVSLAYVTRLTRTSMVENLRSDYVRTATAKGLPRWRVVGVHTFRNSLVPVITFLGIDLGVLLGGSVITESIFNLPGIGQQLYRSITVGEASIVVGFVTAIVILYLVMNLLVDLAYAFLDPRIRYE